MLGLDYASSEDEAPVELVAKRPRTNDTTPPPPKARPTGVPARGGRKRAPTPKRGTLPRLPVTYDGRNPLDDPALHQGRMRARAYVPGDYYAHVYIELPIEGKARQALDAMVASVRERGRHVQTHSFLESQEAEQLESEAVTCAPSPARSSQGHHATPPASAPTSPPAPRSTPMSASSETSSTTASPSPALPPSTDADATLPALHISLTHPLALRRDTAHALASRLASALSRARVPPFSVSLAAPKIYHNAPQAGGTRRAFVALRVGAGGRELAAVLDKGVRPVLSALHVEAYFAQPEWHASFAWCLDRVSGAEEGGDCGRGENGDPTHPDTSPFPPSLLDTLESQMPAVRSLPAWEVREVCVKVGKDVARIPLCK